MHLLRSDLRLSFIADQDLIASGKLTDRAAELLDSGVTTLFLRWNEPRPTQTQLKDIKNAVALCRDRGKYCFTVNDTVFALESGAHGVFFTTPPPRLERVREVLGPRSFIGVNVSSHDHASDLALPEVFDLVDFTAVGPVLQFGEKRYRPVGVEMARRITEILNRKPVLWMGGIRPEDLATFGAGFADGIAVVRSLQTENTLEDVRRFHKLLAKALGPCVWSVGHPPADYSFKFTQLAPEELRSTAVPYKLNQFRF